MSSSFGASQHAPLVLKFDANGNVQWQRTYLSSGRDWGFDIVQTSDGGYVIPGMTDPCACGGTTQGTIIKIDATGNILWQKIYSGQSTFSSIQQTPDGGYIMGGATGSFGAGGTDALVLKLDANGNIQWQQTYGGSGFDAVVIVQLTSDGGYILGGSTTSFGSGGTDAWLLKLNSDGSVAWQKAYGGAGYDDAQYVEQTADGGYVVSGQTNTAAVTGTDLWVFKTDASGNLVWQRRYDSGSPSDVALAVHATSDGGYVVAGFSDPGCPFGCVPAPTPQNFTVLKVKSDGSIDPSCSTGVGAITNATVQNTSATILAAPLVASSFGASANNTNVTVTNTGAPATTLCASGGMAALPSNIGQASSTSSSSPTSAQDNLGTQVPTSEPISTGNGNYYYQHADFTVSGRAMPLVFQRSYNTLDNYSGPLGANWTHSYNIVLSQPASGTIVIKWGDGHGETFTLSGTNYVPQPGVFNTLARNADGTFLLARKDQTQFAFSAGGALTSIRDKNGNVIFLTYDVVGNLVRITDTVGRNLNFTYDSSNRITQITDPIGRAVSYQYDTNSNLVQASDTAGGITTLTYDANHHVTSITQPNGQILLTNTYDSLGRAITQTGGRGFSTTLAYGTPSPGNTTITDARGNQTIHSYDSSLRIVKITDAAGGATSFTYDANNNRTSVTNQNGKATSFAYDGQGNVTGITDPIANAVAFTYDAKNNLLSATNAKGKTTSFTYDGNGNLVRIQDTLANVTAFNYDGFGELSSKTDARGNSTSYVYDSFGNLTRITDALGHTTNLSYDGIGRLISITDPNGHAASANYDALSRLTGIADPLGNQTKFAYDAIGNLLKVTDANGNATNYAYDATNNLVTVTDALGRVTQYAYDANNNRTTFTNAKGNATSYAYDAINRLMRITDPLSFVTSYTYDAVGNVLAVKDAKGQTNQFVYDSLNRLLGIFYADGKAVSYSYDANGNRTSMQDSRGTTAYSYDSIDRLASVTHPSGKVVAYAHDAVGNRSSLTYPDGKTVSYAYDAANRLSRVADWLGRATTYNYDDASNLIGTSYPNTAALAFFHDAANRLTQVRNSYRGSTTLPLNPITSFSYVLDAVGNRLQITDGSGKVKSYGYDALYELTSVTSGTNVTTFAYDAVGNRVQLTAPSTLINYTYDAADRLLTAGTATFTYDANGNQVSKTLSPTAQPILYSYDAANRLVAATGGAAASSFTYDGDGNRITQSVGTGTYTYLNDVATALPVVLQESGPDGFISYAYGLGLISESGSNFDAFYQYDGLGSVVGLTDPSGKLLGRYSYDAWGQTDLSAPGPQLGTKNKFRFTGEALDPGTQLYYLRARYYDPSVGRFLTRDPSEVPLRSRFIYTANNPAKFVDPTGLITIAEGVAVNASVLFGIGGELTLVEDDQGNYGIAFSPNISVGLQIDGSISAVVSLQQGSIKDLQNVGYSINASVGPVSGSILLNENKQFAGFEFGVGPGAGVSIVSASLSYGGSVLPVSHETFLKLEAGLGDAAAPFFAFESATGLSKYTLSCSTRRNRNSQMVLGSCQI